MIVLAHWVGQVYEQDLDTAALLRRHWLKMTLPVHYGIACIRDIWLDFFVHLYIQSMGK